MPRIFFPRKLQQRQQTQQHRWIEQVFNTKIFFFLSLTLAMYFREVLSFRRFTAMQDHQEYGSSYISFLILLKRITSQCSDSMFSLRKRSISADECHCPFSHDRHLLRTPFHVKHRTVICNKHCQSKQVPCQIVHILQIFLERDLVGGGQMLQKFLQTVKFDFNSWESGML